MEVAAAVGGMRDISAEMTGRAEASSDLVSRTLFRVAADERFTGTAKPRRDWQKKAEEGLISLAMEIEKLESPGDEDVQSVLDDYFVWWMSEMIEHRAVIKEDSQDIEELPYIPVERIPDVFGMSGNMVKAGEETQGFSVDPDDMPPVGEESGRYADNDDASRDDSMQEACNRFMNPPKTHQTASDIYRDGQLRLMIE